MRIERLRVTNVRNLQGLDLAPAPRLNLVTGVNASGKTALLEAIYLLARARSFRTARVEDVIQHDHEALQVSADLVHGADGRLVAGIERRRGQLQLRYDGNPVKTVSAHARKLPIVLITPDSHQLLLGGPTARRHWLDWAMFHVEPGYLEAWRDYHRALRQRNARLKDGSAPAELGAWEELLGRGGEMLTAARDGFLQQLDRTFADISASIWPAPPSLRLRAGWSGDGGLQQTLAAARQADTEAGYTRAGPHRADILFSVNGRPLAACFSRGQCKLFVSLLMLAQCRVMAALTGETPLLLFDDFAAELDRRANGALLELLRGERAQTFVTTTHWEPVWGTAEDHARFHVEHGRVAKVIE